MEEDEFNDFQHPVSHQAQKSPQLSHQIEQEIKEQGDKLVNSFFNFDAKNINPSSSLATINFQQLSNNTKSEDFEDTNWPHLNKIQSQNISDLEPNLITFEKSHSQQEHKTDLFDFSPTFVTERTSVIEYSLSQKQEQLIKEQIQNINVTQNTKLGLDFNFSIPNQLKSIQINNHLQINHQNYRNNFISKEKPAEFVQFSSNKQVLVQQNHKILKLQGQNDNIRKQSQQFVFSQPVNPMTIKINNLVERKQSEQFVFQTQQNYPSTSFIQNSSIPQLNLNQVQKQANFQKKKQENQNQLKINNQQPVNNIMQEDKNQNFIIISQNIRTNQQIQEEDQFGDFEQIVQNILPQVHPANLETQIKAENHQNIIQIYESKMPFGVNQFYKKKQLQQLIDSLPNYSSIFAKAFESL